MPQTAGVHRNIVTAASPSAEVTVVVPTKNEGERIEACLRAIQAQSLKPSTILVVDGHSNDHTAEIAISCGATVVFEEGGTRASGLQVALSRISTEYVAFTDADCIADPKWLESLIRAMQAGVAGVGGRIIQAGDGSVQKTINSILASPLGSAKSIQGRTYGSRRLVRSISGSNSLYRTEELRQVGGFDVTLPTAEDTELNARLHNSGMLLYTPDALVYHHHGRGIRQFSRRMYQYGYGRALAMLPDFQIAVPIGLMVALLTLFVSVAFTGILFLAFLLFIVGVGIVLAFRERDLKLALFTPAVLVILYLSYSIGFWHGVPTGIARVLRKSGGRRIE